MNIKILISNQIKKALITIGLSTNCIVRVCHSKRKEFGHYQVDSIISNAKILKISPYQLANKILPLLSFGKIVKKIEICGPGFINIFLNEKWLGSQIDKIFSSYKLGIKKIKPEIIVIDYSGPNVAKEMHVGHLRSTIIGDVTVRVLEFLGHHVIRANHIGDWGTQFGMLIAYLKYINNEYANNLHLSDLEKIYHQSKKCFDKNNTFANHARKYVVKLQNGDPYCKKIWKKLVNITMIQNQLIYNRLNVSLTKNDIMGESLYNSMLSHIVSDLKNKKLAVTSNGATVVFLNEYKNKYGKVMGVIIQKKDGGYLYTTTDLACIKYRYEVLGANRIIYYTDSRQYQHLLQTWSIARKANYIPKSVVLEHHSLGMMLNKNGKPFKTRIGNTIKLSDLLDEAVERAYQLISNKNPHMSEKKIKKIANIIGIGAIKYSDLSKNRTTNYIFDWDNILTFEGNTALYIQYAYTRILSILNRGKVNKNNLTIPTIINQEYEISLAICLLQFEEALITAGTKGTPHIICSYLYNLTGLFSIFYENCQILNIKDEIIRQSRLKLVLLTAKTLKIGLKILGIKTTKYM
ncbi:Arginine--tRNA ligase [Serratia symbiotica]|nr:Arginine--tRNA ligase [Serratia symbiotica]